MATMRAVMIQGGSGPASALYIADDVPRPVPQAGEALVKIKCFGINRMDLSQRNGTYQVPVQAGPILGVEFSGLVVELGPPSKVGVAEQAEGHAKDVFKPGDKVFGLAYGGAYAQYITVSTGMLIHKPSSLSFSIAAAIPETWITALQALYTIGGFAPGKTVLWHAGASSVSLAGIQLSVAGGASAVYVTAGSEEKIALAKDLGATAGWNYKETDWAKGLDEVTTGRGVDILLDFVGKDYFQKNLGSVAMDGRLVIVGLLSGPMVEGPVDLSPFVKRRIRVEGSRLRSRALEYQVTLRDRLVEVALPGLADRRFRVPIERVMDWREIREAHRLMESNAIKGKIVCCVEGDLEER